MLGHKCKLLTVSVADKHGLTLTWKWTKSCQVNESVPEVLLNCFARRVTGRPFS